MPSAVMGGSSGAAEATTGERLLATFVVDVNDDGAQTVYTVPAGKSLLITKALLRSSNVPLSDGGTSSIALTLNGTAVFTFNTTLMTTASRVSLQVRASSVSVQGAAGQTVAATPDAAYGDVATATLELYGIEW